MNNNRYHWIFYLIVFVILGTTCIQVYWNYKNYGVNKQQFVNDVQISLDNAVNLYYTNIAERSTIGYAFQGISINELANNNSQLDSVLGYLKISSKINGDVNNLRTIRKVDSSFVKKNKGKNYKRKGLPNRIILSGNDLQNSDVFNLEYFKALLSKVIISMRMDSINLKEIDSIFKSELKRKKIEFDYNLVYSKSNKESQYLNKIIGNENILDRANRKSILSTFSKSTFLPNESTLRVDFSDITKIILMKIMSGIFLSVILVLFVILSLFFLLSIIKYQKKLAEVKNDLISNITHEFKTPIATISVALESIRDFNVIENKEKTKSYLNISSDQLSKLNVMVEKLLETATLDSEKLVLDKENVNIVEILKTVANKHLLQVNDKTIEQVYCDEEVFANVDVFHFENAINNVIDNAVKYGGDKISILLNQTHISFEIFISDNGNTLVKSDKHHIFEKFYRIPKGNTHDVKGYGIGLYYTKKIIDKHGGDIRLDLSNKVTTFKILLPK